MPEVAEATGARGPLASALKAGVDAISVNQKITFTKYIKLVLPLDGFVFWVKADLVSAGALLNAGTILNKFYPNQKPVVVTPAPTLVAPGSLHYATESKQAAESSYAVNRVVFTSEVAVNDLDEVGPNVIFIAEFEGIKFAFSQRKSFYRQAELFHYVGDAVYPIMESQLVDSLVGLNLNALIVSNSLPIWLSLNALEAYPWEYFGNPGVVLYPAYLVEENAAPPFASVDVLPETTQGIAGAPYLSSNLSHSQLTRERVRITLWGLDNDAAMNFVDFVNQFSLNTDLIGIMNVPTVRDERTTQVELGTIAKRKVVEYEINYYQRAARNVARQLIESAFVDFILN